MSTFPSPGADKNSLCVGAVFFFSPPSSFLHNVYPNSLLIKFLRLLFVRFQPARPRFGQLSVT